MVTFFDIVLGRTMEEEARSARAHSTPLSAALRQYDADVLAGQGETATRKRTIRLLADFVGYQEDYYHTRPDQLGPDALPTHLADLAETGDLSASKRRRLEQVLPAFLAYLATRQGPTAHRREEVMDMAKEPTDDAGARPGFPVTAPRMTRAEWQRRSKTTVSLTRDDLEYLAQAIRRSRALMPDSRRISPQLKTAMTRLRVDTKGL